MQVFFVWWAHSAADRNLQGLRYYNTHLSCHSNCMPWGRSALLPWCMSPSVSLSFFWYILQRKMADEVTGLEFFTRKHFQCTQYLSPFIGFTHNKNHYCSKRSCTIRGVISLISHLWTSLCIHKYVHMKAVVLAAYDNFKHDK